MSAARALAVALSLLALASARAGWVEDAPGGGTVIHLKLFDFPNPSDPSTANRAEVAGLELFKKSFPRRFAETRRDEYKAHPELYGKHNWDKVSVELHPATGIKITGASTDLLQIAGGMAPDIMYINFSKSDTYIRNGFLQPLDEYVASMPKAEFDDRVDPRIIPVIYRKGPDGQKRYWAFPYGGALGKVLWYRKDLFDAHKIPYPDDNWTWEDMYEASRKIADPSRGVYGCRLARGGWFWLTWLWSAGGEVMAYDEKADQWRCVFGSHAGALALDYYVRLATEKWIDKQGHVQRGYSTLESNEDAFAQWDRGEIGMTVAYIDGRIFSSINPEVTGLAPVPLGPPDPKTGKRVRGAELNSRMMGMFSGIKEKAVRDACWDYMRFYDGPEALALKTKVMVEGGMGRFVNPEQLRRFGYADVERLAPPDWARNFKIAIECGKPEPYGKNSALAYMMMGTPVDEALDLSLRDKLPKDREQRLDALQGLLEKAESRANVQMIGLVPPTERLSRRICASVALLGILVAFAFVFKRLFRLFTPPDTLREGKSAWQFRRYVWAYLLLVPAVGTILFWHYIPLLRGSLMAFLDYKLVGQSTFKGVDNFGDLIFDQEWWLSVWNAMRYSFLVLAMTFLPPIILAVALQEVPRGKLLYRVVYYLPAVVTGIVTIVLWKQFYEPSERGALNSLCMHIPAAGFLLAGLALLAVCLAFAQRLRLHGMWLGMGFTVFAGLALLSLFAGLALPILLPNTETLAESLPKLASRLFSFTPEPYRWLNNPNTAMLSCVIPMVWAGMGPGCLIYLAALKGIPDDYYEAADMDGATFIDKILLVVFPTLKSLIVINFVGAFIGSWYSSTDTVLVMTGGGASTQVAGLYIWYKAFTFLDFGRATAAAWLLGMMLIGFTVYQLRMLSRVEFRTADSNKKGG